MCSRSRVCKILDGLVCPSSSRLPVKRWSSSSLPAMSPFLNPARILALALSPLALGFASSEDRSRSSHPAQTSLESRGASGFGSRGVFASQDPARDEDCGDLSLRLAKVPAKDGLGGRRHPRKTSQFPEGCALFQCLLPGLQMSPECNFSALRLIFFARGLSLALIVPIN